MDVIASVPLELLDATLTPTLGSVEVYEDEGILLVHPDIGSVGLSWDELNTLLDNTHVRRKLEELDWA